MSKKQEKKPFPFKQLLRLLLFFILLFFSIKTLYSYLFPPPPLLSPSLNINSSPLFAEHQQKIWDSLQLTLTPLYTPIQFPTKQSVSLPSALQIRTEDIKQNLYKGFHWTLRDLPQRPSLDLICVVDTSGSMSGDKITFVKQSLIEMVEFLGDGDRISIIEFNNRANVIVQLVQAKDNRKKLVENIKTLSAGGGTDIYQGMKQAFSLLSSRETQADVTSVFLLTDGLDNFRQGEQLVNYINSIELNGKFSTNIQTFGYGNDHDSFFLSSFARNNGGEYYYVEEINKIRKYFINAFGQILSIAFPKILIKLSVDQTAQKRLGKQFLIKETFGNMWKEGANENEKNIELEQFQYGVAKDFVLEVEIPYIPDDFIDKINNLTLFQIEVQAEANQQKLSKTIPITFLFAKSSVQIDKKTTLNDHVLINYYRMKLVKLFEQVQALIIRSKQDESKKLLEEFKKDLQIIQEERNLPDFQEMIDEIDKAIRKQSKQGAEHYFKKESDRRASQKFHPDSIKGNSAALNSIQEYMDEL